MRHVFSCPLIIVLIAMTILGGCSAEPEPGLEVIPPNQSPTPVPPVSTPKSVDSPSKSQERQSSISKEEASEFCRDFAERIRAGDKLWLSDHIDIEGIAWKGTENEKSDAAKQLRNEFAHKTQGVYRIISSMVEGTRDLKEYTFRRVIENRNAWTGQFRLIKASNDINFHEAYLTRKKNGEIGISDIFVYTSGVTLSDDIHDSFLLMKEESRQKSLFSRPIGFEKYGQINNAINKHDYAQVLSLFQQLPEPLRVGRKLCRDRLDAAAHIGMQEYQDALAHYNKHFGEDPSKDFAALAIYFRTDNTDLYIAAIDRLNGRLGGDGRLMAMKSNFYTAKSNFPLAIKAAKEGLAIEPDNIDLFDSLLSIGIKSKDNKLIKDTLVELDARIGVDHSRVIKDPNFQDFVKSAEYLEWKKEKENDTSSPTF